MGESRRDHLIALGSSPRPKRASTERDLRRRLPPEGDRLPVGSRIGRVCYGAAREHRPSLRFDASANPLGAATCQTKDVLLDPSIERYERLQEPACTSEARAARPVVAGKRVHLLSYHLDEGSGDWIRDLYWDVDHRVTRYELFVERRRQDDPLHALLWIEPIGALRGFLSVLLLELDHRGAAVEQGVTHDGRFDLQL